MHIYHGQEAYHCRDGSCLFHHSSNATSWRPGKRAGMGWLLSTEHTYSLPVRESLTCFLHPYSCHSCSDISSWRDWHRRLLRLLQVGLDGNCFLKMDLLPMSSCPFSFSCLWTPLGSNFCKCPRCLKIKCSLLSRDPSCCDPVCSSALRTFRLRVLYANVGFDHMVGWQTSSIRRPAELPKVQ